MTERKSVLVTGGMGFIGKVLVKKILGKTEYNVTIVDNLSSSFVDKNIVNNKKVKFIPHDFSTWNPSSNEKFHQIYHLASPVGPVGVLKYKGIIAKIVINQLYKAAELAIENDAKLMEISTSEVYGQHPENEEDGQREDINKIIPANITVRLEYGVAKMLCEIILKNLSRETNIKYNCVRPFNIVGPSQNDSLGFVIPRFLRAALSGQPITVYGNGTQKRTFTHVEDFVNAIFMIMESEICRETFNVGNPNNVISILEVAKKIKQITNSKSEIIFIDPVKLFGGDFAEAWNKIPNVDKLVTAIEWKPNWSMDKIILQITELNKNYLIN